MKLKKEKVKEKEQEQEMKQEEMGKEDVQEMKKDSFKAIDIALFSAGGSISREFAPLAAQAGVLDVAVNGIGSITVDMGEASSPRARRKGRITV